MQSTFRDELDYDFLNVCHYQVLAVLFIVLALENVELLADFTRSCWISHCHCLFS